MGARVKKIVLILLAAALLVCAAQVQHSLNRDRDLLGLTHAPPLENAPPVLAFTTVALGGFRGLISNALWMRAMELQDQDKFFEMVQLADWITKLEPRFPHVWVVQAWNMAYNISVKFKDFEDRWRWVQRGTELLRDHGLRYNPNDVLIHRELAWFFQHKMGDNLDDAHMHYKREWARLMAEALGTNKVDLSELVDPKTDEAKRRAALLREKFKMDPEFMKQLDERYGPLEWRLPEASAIYWAAVGLEKAKLNPGRVNKDDLVMLRRVIYQSMQMSFRRGKLIFNPFAGTVELGPNLDIIPKVNAAYEEQAAEDEKNRDVIKRAHRNFLRDAVYFLYAHARLKEAEQWFNYLATNYPNDNLITGNTNSKPGQITLDEYALARLQEDIGETSRDRVKAILEGLAYNYFRELVLGEYERAEGFRLFARKVYQRYARETADSGERIRIPPPEEIEKEVLKQLLDPEHGWIPEARQRLRTELGLPAEPERSRTNQAQGALTPS
ncbi:MAG: hypothetical protein NZ739_05080 [Verrucomicrobiae bacterium]|nr:hypothetical protein [Verrucomicrobiae bacterium]MDW7979511.1 hypothetical protein [Verrucomicrobiales bacterium]